MILDATTKSIEIDLGEAHTTNALPVTVDYVDLTTTTTIAGSSDTASNGTTAVTIVAAPAASTQRKVNFISVYNADTVSHVTTIQLNNNTTLRTIVKVTLASLDILEYTDVSGWKVLDSAGRVKTEWFGSSPTITTPNIIGVTDASDASAGSVGEYISASLASTSATALTTTVTTTVTSISLTAGDWDVSATIGFDFDATTNVTLLRGNPGTAGIDTAAGFSLAYGAAGIVFGSGATTRVTGSCRIQRINVSTTTTVNLYARADFTVAACRAYGTIVARRVR